MVGEPVRRPLPVLEHLGQGRSELALEVLQERQAGLDFLQPRRVGLEPLAVHPKPLDDVHQAEAELGQLFFKRALFGVQLDQLLEGAARGLDAVQGRGLPLAQELQRFPGQPGELYHGPQALPLTQERLLFGRLGAGVVYFLQLVAPEFELPFVGRGRFLQLGQGSLGRSHRLEAAGDILPEPGQVVEGVEKLELRLGLEECLVLVLAVKVHQMVAQGGEGGDGDEVPAEPAARPPTRVHPAADDELLMGRFDSELLRQLRGQLHVAEDGLYLGGRSPAPHRVGLGSLPEGQTDGPDQDALPRPGGAGDGAQAAVQLHLQVRDGGQVTDGQVREHASGLYSRGSDSCPRGACRAGRRRNRAGRPGPGRPCVRRVAG